MVKCGGQAGELYWSYLPAAALGPWTLTATPTSCDLTATVVSHDAFRVEQRDLTFRVSRQNAAPWIWPVESLQIADGVLTARLTQTE